MNPLKATNRAIRELQSLGYSVIITQQMPGVASYSRMRSEGALVQWRTSWKCAPMIESDAEVARTLSAIPVRASRQMTATEYQVRAAEVLNLFDIEAVVDETGGMHYGDEGVDLEDQPLEASVRILIGRRFGIPESLI